MHVIHSAASHQNELVFVLFLDQAVLCKQF